jgi:uncharacterized integral membrane protein (TIGR00698 family)
MSVEIQAGTRHRNSERTNEIINLVISFGIVLGLGVVVWWLTKEFPKLFTGDLNRTLRTIEFPVYAIVLGLAANGVLYAIGWRERVAGAFRTELFLKTGVILLGAGINLVDLFRIGIGGLLQAAILITAVFFTAWYLGGVFKLDQHLRALISASVAICGVSAAIAAAGAVQAKKEQLGYVASLVIVFSLPLIFIQPALANLFGLSQPVAGAWIGGNIDTSAAVTAGGTLAGAEALKYATVVKLSQNALMGIIAFLLALYWITQVERDPNRARPKVSELFTRFPKFVIGFVAASLIMTLLINFNLLGSTKESATVVADINALRTWLFTLAFVSIGLSFRLEGFKAAGWRPLVVYGLATFANLVIALAVASLIFGWLGFR